MYKIVTKAHFGGIIIIWIFKANFVNVNFSKIIQEYMISLSADGNQSITSKTKKNKSPILPPKDTCMLQLSSKTLSI
jgi:hypothetical protein